MSGEPGATLLFEGVPFPADVRVTGTSYRWSGLRFAGARGESGFRGSAITCDPKRFGQHGRFVSNHAQLDPSR